MPVNLSIKNAPDNLVELVKERAEKNHRSLRGELLAIIEEAVKPPRPVRMTPREILEQGRKLGLKTAADSVKIIRKMRDERYGG
jgi:plasmid stability protein